MTTYGITVEGMTIYCEGQPIASFPIADFPLMIERLARAMQEGVTGKHHAQSTSLARQPGEGS